EQLFSSTVNRLEPFWDSTLALMFGANEGVDFIKMITEGWVILVNLYSGLGFEPIHTRLLGTTVINEIIFGLDRLRNKGWRGVYYLYIDEAGRYANRNLADLLAYKRKSGLRVTVAHQYFKQFEDPTVLEAVKNLCKIKVMFDTPNPADRLEMIKALGYGGDIPAVAATYANQNLPKQYAIIKKGKTTPERARIEDVTEVKPQKKRDDEFKTKIRNEWNLSSDQVWNQINERFNGTTNDTRPPEKGAAPNRPTAGRSLQRPKSVFDDD